MLYTAPEYISDRCYKGTIMATLSVTQYCHVHFNGGGVVVLESTCTTPKTLYTRVKSFFKAALARWRYFITTTRILFVFSFHVFFLIW